MAKQITSHNQQGGITAEKVTVGGDTTTKVAPQKRSRWKLWALIGAIGAIIALLANLATILEFFGLKLGE